MIADLPEREAHDLLDETRQHWAGQFDVSLKLDTHMMTRRLGLLAGIAERLARAPGRLRLTMTVDDWFSDRRIHGMHAFRNTVRGKPRGDVLNDFGGRLEASGKENPALACR